MKKNVKHLAFGVCVAFVLLGAFVGGVSATTWYVEEGESIQAVVDAASAGDTIIVRDGIYTENINVNKYLKIKSENSFASTIIQAADSDNPVFNVTGCPANINEFTVKGASNSDGISLYNAYYCIISNNEILDNGIGIRLDSSTYLNNISSNKLSNNSCGISLISSSNNVISNNMVKSPWEKWSYYLPYYSISLYESSNNKISNNTCEDHTYGISLTSSSHNIISKNICRNNSDGIFLSPPVFYASSNKSLGNHHSGLQSNINGMSENDYYPVGSENNAISFNTLEENNYCGISFWYSSNNSVYLNNFIRNAENAESDSSNNTWNSTSSITYKYNGNTYTNYMGNYWDNYTGIDADNDGIGDTAYDIPDYFNPSNPSNKDYHPLIIKLENYNIKFPIHNIDNKKDFLTIQDAINDPETGWTDTITVDPGVYYENVKLDKELTIKSTSGNPEDTIIKAKNTNDHVIALESICLNRGPTISGFTLEGAIDGKAGIYLGKEIVPGINFGTSYCNIFNNKILNNSYGIYLEEDSSNNTFENNTVLNNSYGIYLDDSSNNTLENNNVSNNDHNIYLESSSNNKIINNNVSFSEWGIGIWLSDSSENEIANNTVIFNGWHGISLRSSSNNKLIDNEISNSRESGIELIDSSCNEMVRNNISSSGCWGGINMWNSNSNSICLNNFINNSGDIDSYESTNIWNSTEKITYTYNGRTFTNYTGNYWDDYKEKYPDAEEIDETGIWDIPYSIDGDKDNYPLVEEFENYFGGVEEYSALIKCISSETDFYKKSSETTFDSWWWTEKADEEMEEAMNVLASSLVGSVAGAELQLALLGTGSKIVKVIGPVGYMMTAYDVVNAISKGLDSRFYSDIGWAIAGDSVLIQGDLNNLVANGNNLTNALKDKNESRIESLLEKRAYLISVVYEDLATIDKNAATSLKNPTPTIHLYVPSDEYQLIHSHAATLHFQLQRDYSVTISALNNLTEEEYNPFLHEQCPEGKIEPQRLDKGELGWCYGCLDHTGDSDKFNIRVPSESDALCVVNTYGLHEISPANITLRLEQDGELIKESSDKLIIESPEEGTYNLYVESRNGSQVYGFCTHTDLCGGWKILPTDIQPAWEAYPEYPDPIIIDYLTNPIKVDKDKVSTEEEITVSVNASNEGGKSAWQSIAISSPDIENTESYTILDSNLDYCEKYGIGYEAGYNYGNTTKPLKYPLIEGAKNNWEGGFTGNVTLKIKPEKEGILRVYAKSVAYGSGVWRSAPGIFETHTKGLPRNKLISFIITKNAHISSWMI